MLFNWFWNILASSFALISFIRDFLIKLVTIIVTLCFLKGRENLQCTKYSYHSVRDSHSFQLFEKSLFPIIDKENKHNLKSNDHNLLVHSPKSKFIHLEPPLWHFMGKCIIHAICKRIILINIPVIITLFFVFISVWVKLNFKIDFKLTLRLTKN